MSITIITTIIISINCTQPVLIIVVKKKHKYLQACQDGCATFTLFCVTVDGMHDFEVEFFVKRLGDFLIGFKAGETL